MCNPPLKNPAPEHSKATTLFDTLKQACYSSLMKTIINTRYIKRLRPKYDSLFALHFTEGYLIIGEGPCSYIAVIYEQHDGKDYKYTILGPELKEWLKDKDTIEFIHGPNGLEVGN